MTAPAHPLVPAARPAGPRQPQWLAVASYAVVGHAVIGLIALGIGVLVSAIVLGAQAIWWSVDGSFVISLSSLQFGVPFALSLVLVRQHMFTFVAHGATRPAVIGGNLASAPVAGLLWGVVGALLLALEGLAFRLVGWEHAMPDVDGLSSWERGWWFVLGAGLVNVTAIALAGQLTGALFYRFHGHAVLVAILLVVPAVAPAAAVVALGTGHDLEGPAFGTILPIGPGPVVSTSVIAGAVLVAAVGLTLLLRHAPVRSRS